MEEYGGGWWFQQGAGGGEELDKFKAAVSPTWSNGGDDGVCVW